jgi:HK97 family phage prohead protease
MKDMEVRTIIGELRATEPGRIGGHAVTWNQPSRGLPFEERFVRGAFLDSLADSTQDVSLLWAHDPTKPLASRIAGSLTVAEDDLGLGFDAKLNGTSWSVDAYEAIRSKSVRTVSFRFSVPTGGDTWQHKGPKLDG